MRSCSFAACASVCLCLCLLFVNQSICNDSHLQMIRWIRRSPAINTCIVEYVGRSRYCLRPTYRRRERISILLFRIVQSLLHRIASAACTEFIYTCWSICIADNVETVHHHRRPTHWQIIIIIIGICAAPNGNQCTVDRASEVDSIAFTMIIGYYCRCCRCCCCCCCWYWQSTVAPFELQHNFIIDDGTRCTMATDESWRREKESERRREQNDMKTRDSQHRVGDWSFAIFCISSSLLRRFSQNAIARHTDVRHKFIGNNTKRNERNIHQRHCNDDVHWWDSHAIFNRSQMVYDDNEIGNGTTAKCVVGCVCVCADAFDENKNTALVGASN